MLRKAEFTKQEITLTFKCFWFVSDHFKIFTRQLQCKLLCKSLYVHFRWNHLLSTSAILFLVEPLGFINLPHDAKHFGDIILHHVQTIFQEKLMHFTHVYRVAPICVKLGKHLINLLVCLDLCRTHVVLALNVIFLLLGVRSLRFKPPHDC